MEGRNAADGSTGAKTNSWGGGVEGGVDGDGGLSCGAKQFAAIVTQHSDSFPFACLVDVFLPFIFYRMTYFFSYPDQSICHS